MSCSHGIGEGIEFRQSRDCTVVHGLHGHNIVTEIFVSLHVSGVPSLVQEIIALDSSMRADFHVLIYWKYRIWVHLENYI